MPLVLLVFLSALCFRSVLQLIRKLQRFAAQVIGEDRVHHALDPAGIDAVFDRCFEIDEVFEGEQVEFHRRVREGFLEIARSDPARVTVLDSTQPKPKVTTAILAAVRKILA